MNVGKSTRVALAKAGWKQNDLAEVLGISKASLSRTINNTSGNVETVRKLAAAFNLKCSEFIALGE